LFVIVLICREEQIIQKEQILAELQRVEKELQEKAQAQMMLTAATSIMQQQDGDKAGQLQPVQQLQQINEVLMINSVSPTLSSAHITQIHQALLSLQSPSEYCSQTVQLSRKKSVPVFE
jgi:hypothetical protein